MRGTVRRGREEWRGSHSLEKHGGKARWLSTDTSVTALFWVMVTRSSGFSVSCVSSSFSVAPSASGWGQQWLFPNPPACHICGNLIPLLIFLFQGYLLWFYFSTQILTDILNTLTLTLMLYFPANMFSNKYLFDKGYSQPTFQFSLSIPREVHLLWNNLVIVHL